MPLDGFLILVRNHLVYILQDPWLVWKHKKGIMLKSINYLNRIVICSILFISASFAGEIRDKAVQIIADNFSDSAEVITYKLSINKSLKSSSEKFAQQRFFSNFVYYYEIKEKNETIGFAVLDNVLGKVKPITFLVILNSDLSVKSVDIIKYREQYGGAIEKKAWLDQFLSKNIESELKLNTGIDGISGATISVKAVIKGVKRLLYLVNNLGEDERNLLVSIK
jgi:Na+-translocating ferredoxin:NAD+ oxidoreductase RnfG subunit